MHVRCLYKKEEFRKMGRIEREGKKSDGKKTRREGKIEGFMVGKEMEEDSEKRKGEIRERGGGAKR